MKKYLQFLVCSIAASMWLCNIQAQEGLVSTTIEETSVDMRSAPVVLGSVNITVASVGTVVVDFNGNCVSSDGDRILLAASNNMGWGVNDGHVSVEAYDGDVNRNSFSHTRAYAVGPGTHTFYAVGQNYLEVDGTGIASVYGMLNARFFPDAGPAIVQHTGISETFVDVRTNQVALDSILLDAPTSGKVYVKFNGKCTSDVGDLIVLAASDSPNWGVNDGNVGAEAISADLNQRAFSHSRVYSVLPGPHTFYAVAHNYVETDGSGVASIYGSLTVEYFPDGGDLTVDHEGVIQVNVLVEGAPVVTGDVTISPVVDGTAVVTYDGSCSSSPGDRIIMAASDDMDWDANAGNVNVEAISADYNRNSFSHTKVYPITAGTHTFYSICENIVETDGSGVASNYGSLTVQFWPAINIGQEELEDVSDRLIISPNPVADFLSLDLGPLGNEEWDIKVFDVSGKLMWEKEGVVNDRELIELSGFSNGSYVVHVSSSSFRATKSFIKQ